ADVERELTLGGNLSIDSETIVRSEDDSRPELTYRIIDIDSDFEPLRDPLDTYLLTAKSEWDLKNIVAESKKRAMYDLIHNIPTEIEKLNTADKNRGCRLLDYSASHFYTADERGKYNHAGIVFCPHVHGTFGVNDNEPGNGISAGLMAESGTALRIGTFIGGDKPSGDMKSFNDNDFNLMVATKAFGMGIDKPNVRFTININHPSSLESFVQESGRAGRDKKHAIAYILYDPTEYIHLTADKIQLLRGKVYSALGVDPLWLESESYIDKFILHSDFLTLCNMHNDSQEVTNKLLSICKEHSLFENIDKNIPLWFHNNSFRGSYKERVILLEFTDRLLNAKATYLHQIQESLVEETGNRDILLKPDIKKNAVKILSKEDSKHQYGYIFLDNLFPTLKFVDFDLPTCHQICSTLIKILSEYDDHT
ncbi:MAG: hypothetical protein K2H85_00760, partial [Allobaculum sp.]|nr:hypothetical protein [Allobaculum sp.]